MRPPVTRKFTSSNLVGSAKFVDSVDTLEYNDSTMFDRKEYYQKTRKKQIATAKRWRKNNLERSNAHRRRTAANMRKNNYVTVMLYGIKQRAKRKGICFTLTKADIVIPTHCPVLGIPLVQTNKGLHQDDSPSLDRIVPSLGYVSGNVKIISWRANRIKCDATSKELQLISQYYGTLAELA